MSYKKILLLVEDNIDVGEMFKHQLSSMGHEVVLVEDGLKALSILDDDLTRFDCILTDYSMPGMSGVDLINQVRVHTDIPVILISGYSSLEELTNGKQLVNVWFLMKPAMSRDLKRVLDKIFKH